MIDRSGWHRPIIVGSEAMVSSGHYLASLAGLEVLKKGGNAIDAGVAMGLCINVVQPEFTNLGGVAPIMIYSASEDKVINISGLGTWPRSITIEAIKERGGLTDKHFTNSVVPSALDAWIKALELYGSMSFSEVAQDAYKIALKGFPAYPIFINNLVLNPKYTEDEYTTKVFMPSGTLPEIGDPIPQTDLARTFQRLMDAEDSCSLGRSGALNAVREEFYQGSIARDLIDYVQRQGGFMTMEDLAGFQVGLEQPVRTYYRDVEVYCCGPWCQGPVNALALNILENYELSGLEHNSAEYIHILASALDLAFADREHYIGDPNFVKVPIEELASKRYAEQRKKLISEKTWGKMPPPGDPANLKGEASSWTEPTTGEKAYGTDTSYCCAVDKEGNAFSSTPSDGGKLVPGLGIVVSPRGVMSWLDPDHASSVAAGKRPRLTPNPALAFKDNELYMAYGTPGGDSQPQTMVQLIVNVVDFKMNIQQAIEAPRFRSANFPDTHWPHEYIPGRLNVESRISKETVAELRKIGYDVNLFPDFTHQCGGACAIIVDQKRGIFMGGADPRRECYALGF